MFEKWSPIWKKVECCLCFVQVFDTITKLLFPVCSDFSSTICWNILSRRYWQSYFWHRCILVSVSLTIKGNMKPDRFKQLLIKSAHFGVKYMRVYFWDLLLVYWNFKRIKYMCYFERIHGITVSKPSHFLGLNCTFGYVITVESLLQKSHSRFLKKQHL